ncbi:hypothetical protein EVAR_87029_1 [Eumeta japonica]|uniref:Uncharacterized protein n=1 Tax=Eumeta variegata TaxID=151549 RepID=A0A4C1Z3S3_EUMVA|nr:hypothetical protein EVAR_87029_1 [Eumeta japonica]
MDSFIRSHYRPRSTPSVFTIICLVYGHHLLHIADIYDINTDKDQFIYAPVTINKEIDASQAKRLGRSCLSIAHCALSLARSDQAERDNESCFFVRAAGVHRFDTACPVVLRPVSESFGGSLYSHPSPPSLDTLFPSKTPATHRTGSGSSIAIESKTEIENETEMENETEIGIESEPRSRMRPRAESRVRPRSESRVRPRAGSRVSRDQE